MQRKQSSPLVGKLAGHLAIGTCLGVIFALSLVVTNIASISEMVRSTSQPVQSLLVLVIGFGSFFGVGATITGFLLEEIDRHG
jgi:hypothetical protein